MPISPLRIAVTGAAGHVGTEVCLQALKDGHTVIGLDRPPISHVPAQERWTYKPTDLTNYDAFKAAVEGCDAMIHLAAVLSHLKSADAHPQHVMYTTNTSMSYNALLIAAELGIKRVVMASSVNAIGMAFSKRPTVHYVPLDEKHPFYPEDAYSLSKYFVELQSNAFARKDPEMRIATLRFHWATPHELCNADDLDKNSTGWKDLWGWVSLSAAGRACLLGLTAPESTFPNGHETFFIVAPTICRKKSSKELVKEFHQETEIRGELKGNQGLFDCRKAESMLGWHEDGYFWSEE